MNLQTMLTSIKKILPQLSIQDLEYLEVFPKGLNKEIVEAISKIKNEPEWMLKKRLNSYYLYKYYVFLLILGYFVLYISISLQLVEPSRIDVTGHKGGTHHENRHCRGTRKYSHTNGKDTF